MDTPKIEPPKSNCCDSDVYFKADFELTEWHNRQGLPIFSPSDYLSYCCKCTEECELTHDKYQLEL